MIDWLSTYLLPGRIFDPCDGPAHARTAEQLGFGGVWLSDRWDQKEAGAMLGAVSQATTAVRFGTAVTHPHTRHPLVLAGMGTTLQALSGGRFTLGLGRSAGGIWPGHGLKSPSTQMLMDTARLLRRLWAGDTVDYDGPLGRFPAIHATHRYLGPPPGLALAAIGPRTLELAGQEYDEVILHPFLTTDSVSRSAAIVRAAAERAGRDPAAVRVIATIAVAPSLSVERSAAVVTGRLITYLQAAGMGELLVEVNQWAPAVLDAVRSHPKFASLSGGLADWAFSLDELSEVGSVLPHSWVAEGAAVGDDTQCAARVEDYRAAGADEVMVHGNAPEQLAGVVAALAHRSSAGSPREVDTSDPRAVRPSD